MKTKKELIAFEDWVVNTFNDGKLRSPVHLSGSKDGRQEKELIKIFKQIQPQDWVFSTYRSHYHALLKGIPEDWLKQWILNNKSIHVMNKEHKFFTSAIVGGCLPIALGVAMAIKRNHNPDNSISDDRAPIKDKCEGSTPSVWIFIGDMTATTGIFNDCLTYAYNFNLPITFVIEDNGLSTDTKTAEVWGQKEENLRAYFKAVENIYSTHVIYYDYKRKYVHYGTGKFISKLWEGIEKDDARVKGF